MASQIIKTENKSKEKYTQPRRQRIKRLIRNFLFSCAWLYICVSLIYATPDIMIIKKYDLMDMGAYAGMKIIFITFFIITFWLIVDNLRFWKLIGLFLLFPIYPVFFKTVIRSIILPIGYFAEKKWYSLLYGYIELLSAFFFKFKKIVFRFSLLMASVFFLFVLPDKYQIITIVLFVILQLIHLISRVREVKEPFRILQFPVNEIEEFINDPKNPSKIDEIISGESNNASKKDEKESIEQFEAILLLTKLIKMLQSRIHEILTRRTYILSFMWKYIFSCFLAMLYFGAMNFGLFKYSPEEFTVTTNPNYFEFFYYSFFTIFPDTTSIIPVGVVSKTLRMSGVFVGVFLNALLFIVFITSNGERFKESLTSLLHSFNRYSGDIQSYFKAKHGMSYLAIRAILKSAGSQIEKYIDTE